MNNYKEWTKACMNCSSSSQVLNNFGVANNPIKIKDFKILFTSTRTIAEVDKFGKPIKRTIIDT